MHLTDTGNHQVNFWVSENFIDFSSNINYKTFENTDIISAICILYLRIFSVSYIQSMLNGYYVFRHRWGDLPKPDVFRKQQRREKGEKKVTICSKTFKKDQLAETFLKPIAENFLKWTYFDPGYSFFSLHHSCSFCWLTITDLENAKK